MSIVQNVKKTAISAVIITFNARELVDRCISSICKNTRYEIEIYLIDNGSSDGTSAWISEKYPDIYLIRNKRNRGVAPARNQGLRLCRGDFILIIDDDAYLLPDSIMKFVSFMNENKTVGLCGPKLFDADNSIIPSCKRFPNPLSFIGNRLSLVNRLDGQTNLDYHLMRDWDHNSVARVDYIIGACQFIRREAFEDVGLLDDKIYYGPEDIDFCVRLWKRNWEVVYLSDILGYHTPRRRTRQNMLSMLSLRHFLAVGRFFSKYRMKDLRNITAKNDDGLKSISRNQE